MDRRAIQGALLRYCLGAQKNKHLLRVLWSPHVSSFAEQTDDDLRETMDAILGCSLSDSSWLQCCLPVRYGGFGIQNPSLTRPAAYFSSVVTDLSGAFSPIGAIAAPTPELWEAARELSGQTESPSLSQWNASEELPSPVQIVKDQALAQNFWAGQVPRRLQRELFESASLCGMVRLRSESQQHGGDWLLSPPNHNLGSHFDKCCC